MSDKKLSLKDFKMWLEGVEEMQSEGWTPTPEQWNKIRSKIDIIEETVVIPNTQQVSPPYKQEMPADFPIYNTAELVTPRVDHSQLHPVFSTGNPTSASRLLPGGDDAPYAPPFL